MPHVHGQRALSAARSHGLWRDDRGRKPAWQTDRQSRSRSRGAIRHAVRSGRAGAARVVRQAVHASEYTKSLSYVGRSTQEREKEIAQHEHGTRICDCWIARRCITPVDAVAASGATVARFLLVFARPPQRARRQEGRSGRALGRGTRTQKFAVAPVETLSVNPEQNLKKKAASYPAACLISKMQILERQT